MIAAIGRTHRSLRIFLGARAARGRELSVVARYAHLRACKFLNISCWVNLRGSDLRMRYRPGCTITEKCFLLGKYDYDGMSVLEEFIGPGDRFFDIGANVGPFSLITHRSGACVHAFEGARATWERRVVSSSPVFLLLVHRATDTSRP